MGHSRDDWPHFGDDFLAYEQVLKHAGSELFGDIQGMVHERLSGANRYDELIHTREMDTDQATALGWSISWYGLWRTCTPNSVLSMPAVGLTGWLANAPDRPVDVPLRRWRDQMFLWLSEDLARSAWAWSRIAQFMRARGAYVLRGQFAQPSAFAELRAHLVGDDDR